MISRIALILFLLLYAIARLIYSPGFTPAAAVAALVAGVAMALGV